MAQPFFHRRQHILAGFGEDHPIGVQASAGEAGGEQIGLPQHPQHRAGQTSEQAGDEQGGRGGVFGIRSGAHGFMQGPQPQAAGRQNLVDGGNTERQGAIGAGGGGSVFDPRDFGAQVVQDGRAEGLGWGGDRKEHKTNIGIKSSSSRVENSGVGRKSDMGPVRRLSVP